MPPRSTTPTTWCPGVTGDFQSSSSPSTTCRSDQQMNYTRSALDSLPGRDRIHKRLEELERVDMVNAPSEHGGRYFFTKRLAAQDQFVLYMRTGAEGKDEVLVDPNPLSPDHSTSVALMGISRDGRLLGYGLRKGGEDETPVSLLDTVTRKTLRDQLPRARYMGFAIKPDRSGVYNSKFTPAGWLVHYHATRSYATKDP